MLLASLPTVSILLNSVVMTDAFFGSIDLTDFYLGTPFPTPPPNTSKSTLTVSPQLSLRGRDFANLDSQDTRGIGSSLEILPPGIQDWG